MNHHYSSLLLIVGGLLLLLATITTVPAKGAPIAGDDIGYALRQSPSGNVIVTFPLDNPSGETLVTGYGPLVGADFVNDVFTHWYTLTENNVLSRQNVSSGQPVVVGGPIPQFGETWHGMTWDRTTTTMYAVASTNCNGPTPSSTLYTIDLTNGEATIIGSVTNGQCLIDVAAHPTTGVLYTVDSHTNSTLTISKSTGAGTILGATGIEADQGRQGLDFHDGNGTLYYTALVSNMGELATIDITDGTATLVGIFGPDSYRDAFAIPISPTPTAIQIGTISVTRLFPSKLFVIAGILMVASLYLRNRIRAK